MAIIFFAKLYITFQKKRQSPEERKIDLIINSIFAILFTVALIDLLLTVPQILDLLNKARGIV
jgi:hypothetical protein